MSLTRALTLSLLAVGGLAACQDNEGAIARGDRLWADSSFLAATAEYQLAAAQRDDEDALGRLAHAQARVGQVAEAREVYDRLLSSSSEHADQAAYDFLQIVNRSLRRGDPLGVAVALDVALQVRPELQLPGAVRSAARLYRERGDLERAATYYRRALTSMPADSTPPVLYEIGMLYEELNRCDVAIDYFNATREQANASSRNWTTLISEARWQTGSCAFRLGQAARAEGEVMDALAHYDAVIGLGEPENLLDQAWFERGEILFGIGRHDEALESYRAVLARNPARTGQLVQRAQRRIDQIRFGDFDVDVDADPVPDGN